MPGEGLTHGPRAVKKHGEGTTGPAGSSGIPCAMGYGLYVLSPVRRACWPPSRESHHLARLTPASGCQDHTSLFKSLVKQRAAMKCFEISTLALTSLCGGIAVSPN